MNIFLKRHRIIIVLLLILCTGANHIYGEGLSLDSCLTLALQNNVKLKNASLEVEAAKQVKKQAFTKYFPNISGIAAGYQALEPFVEFGISDIGNAGVRALLNTLYAEYGTALGLPNSLELFRHGIVGGVTAVQPVFAGGQIVNGNKLAKLGVKAAELQTEMTEQEVLLQTEESYWLVVSLHEKAKTIEQVKVLLDTIYRDAHAARMAGLVTENDVFKVTLKQNEMNSNQLKVENGIRLATMALCQSIGIEYTDTLQLADSLTAVMDEPLQYYKNADETVSERTEKKLLDLSVEAEVLQRKMTVGSTLPTVAVGAGYVYTNLFERNDFNGMVFATVQIPITGWWETGHKLKQQKIKQQIAENNRKDLTEKLGLQTQQAWNELEEAYSQVALADTTLENARQNMTLAQQNFHAGLISLSELLEAQTLFRQAIDQQCDARITYRIKLSRYKQYVGVGK